MGALDYFMSMMPAQQEQTPLDAKRASARAAAGQGPEKPPQPAVNEQEFQQWWANMAKKLDLDPNPDAPDAYYDMRGFYKAMKDGKYLPPDAPGGHFPSEFKSPDHPRAYLVDPVNQRFFDTKTGNYTGGAKEPVSEERMNLLNKTDIPDPSHQNWLAAKGGQDKQNPDYKQIGESLALPSSQKLPEASPLDAKRAAAQVQTSALDKLRGLFQ